MTNEFVAAQMNPQNIKLSNLKREIDKLRVYFSRLENQQAELPAAALHPPKLIVSARSYVEFNSS
jgi:hypothetical protein